MKKTTDRWTAALQNALISKDEKAPEGYKTREELSEIFKMKKTRTQTMVNRMVEQKVAIAKKFKVLKNGNIQWMSHYRLVKSPK